MVKKRQFPIVGGGIGVRSFTRVEDAARATALAVSRGVAGVYNIVDDEGVGVVIGTCIGVGVVIGTCTGIGVIIGTCTGVGMVTGTGTGVGMVAGTGTGVGMVAGTG